MGNDYSDIEKAIQENNLDFIQSVKSERIMESRLFGDAIEKGNLEMVKLFIEHGVSIADPSTWTSLFPIENAAAGGHLEIVKLLVSKGCKVNPEIGRHAGFATPNSALARAVYANHEKVVEFLLVNGADQNLKLYPDNNSPLYDAVQNSYGKIIDLLLEYKPDFKWKKNKAAISLAAKQGNYDILEKLLIASKVKMKSVKSFYSPRGAFHSPLEDAVLHNNFECVKLLIEYGANPNAAVNDLGFTPINIAIHNGNIEILNYLLDNGGKFITNIKEMNYRIPNGVYVHNSGRLNEVAEKSGNPEMIEFVKQIEEKIFKEI